MQQAIQIRRPQTTTAQQMIAPRAAHPARRALGQGTPVDLSLLFWGGSLLLLAVYFLGGGEPSRPLRVRKVRDESSSKLVSEAVSALRNLGYSRSEALSAVNAARRDGARSFDDVMGKAMRQLA